MEQAFLDWLAPRLKASERVPWGIADDTALVNIASGNLLVTTDLVSDEVDFVLSQVDPRRVGRKALAVNLSDMAAMAAKPVAAVVSLLLPQTGAATGGLPGAGSVHLDTLALAQQLYEGLLPLAEEFDVAIAGGDVNTWNHPLAINITLLGEPGPAGPLRRTGAQPGDWILVTGSLGGSILGHHFDFQPRVAEAQWLQANYTLHAGMDISDGLTLDLSRLAKASNRGAVLNLAQVPISPAAQQLANTSTDSRSALDHALGDGEDFELLLAVPPTEARRLLHDQPFANMPITHIGQFTAEEGLWSVDPAGDQQLLEPRGFLHGSSLLK